MTNCNENQYLDAYVDGELPAADRERFEAHLTICAACAREVARLRQLSSLFTAYRPTLPADALDRLHDAVAQTWDLGVIRLARRISAVAASVVLFGSLYLTLFQTEQATASLPVWEQSAVSGTLPATESADAEPQVQLAQWIVSDLSTGR
jgi:anti-sigma factor RsiW